MAFLTRIAKQIPLLGNLISNKLVSVRLASMVAPAVPKLSQQISSGVVSNKIHTSLRISGRSGGLLTPRSINDLGLVGVRYASYKVICKKPKRRKKKCKKVKHRCYKPKFRHPKRGEDHPHRPFKTMWKTVDCCHDVCSEVFREDLFHYVLTDKTAVKYPRTWNKCNVFHVRPKRLCRQKHIIMPEIRRRKRKPRTACKVVKDKCTHAESKCRTIKLKQCRKARHPPRCKRDRYPKKCKKIPAPRKSFSECKKDDPKWRHPVECNCLRRVAMCESYRYLAKRYGHL